VSDLTTDADHTD